jgi:hypothetical protein
MDEKYKFIDQKVRHALLLALIFLGNSACSGTANYNDSTKEVSSSDATSNRTGDFPMSNEKLVELLESIDPELFPSNEKLEEEIYMKLPMSHEEGVAIRLLERVGIHRQRDASIIILIGIGADRNSRTPLSEHARIKWTNLESNLTSEVRLFEEPRYKIPISDNAMPPPPENPMEAVHSYSVEIVNIKNKLGFEWVPSKYIIQIIAGDMVSNKVDFEITAPSDLRSD